MATFTNRLPAIERWLVEDRDPDSMSLAQRALAEGAVPPKYDLTAEERSSGNYRKLPITVGTLTILVENPRGSVREGEMGDGTKWQTLMQDDYGEIAGTEGRDGDPVDVFLSDTPDQGKIFIIDQVNPATGEFDESKVMMGWDDAQAAKRAYMSNYQSGWQGFKDITEVDLDGFLAWLKNPLTKAVSFKDFLYQPDPVRRAVEKGIVIVP